MQRNHQNILRHGHIMALSAFACVLALSQVGGDADETQDQSPSDQGKLPGRGARMLSPYRVLCMLGSVKHVNLSQPIDVSSLALIACHHDAHAFAPSPRCMKQGAYNRSMRHL